VQTRPTSDRLRETLFNILAPRIGCARFLDLCAGTGAIGIEALSRGASHVTFVDQSREMCGLIEQNLKALGVELDGREVIIADTADYLSLHLSTSEFMYDIVYFDPPYASDYDAVLGFVAEHSQRILREDGVVIVEHSRKKLLPDRIKLLARYRELKQGDSVLSFYRAT
jgi:16S rRNA (guanine966-N2)-methyltransferase